MAVISPDTFDNLSRYVGVRLQQGVPIVDADWNEAEDVRRFELRAFLKWYVGNGVPEGNPDAFRIVGQGAANDFLIASGVSGPADGLGNVGRCLVDGLDAIIDENRLYREQRLYSGRPGSAELAETLEVPPIEPVPDLDGTVTVYLDLWERTVSPDEDPTLVHPGLGTESCARVRREWVVRTRAGDGPPPAGAPEHRRDHGYYPLATIDRRAGDALIHPEDVHDLREQHLLMPPATLVPDLLGVEAEDYRRGRGRPGVSLRSAINALLRGELPSTPESALTGGAPDVLPARTPVAADGALWVFWQRGDRLWTRRFRDGAWEAEQPLTAGGGPGDQDPMAVRDGEGDIWLFWRRLSDGLWYRRYRHADHAWDDEVQVPALGTDCREPYVLADPAGDLWLFYREGTNLYAQHRDHAAGDWDDPPEQLTHQSSAHPQALVDGDGRIRLFYDGHRGGDGRRIRSRIRAGGGWGAEERLSTTNGTDDRAPWAVAAPDGTLWLFWSHRQGSSYGIEGTRYDPGTAAWSAPETLAAPAGSRETQPFPLADPEGGLWLFGLDCTSPLDARLLAWHRPPGSADWGVAWCLAPEAWNSQPSAVQTDDGTLWVLWQGNRGAGRNLYCRRLYTAI